LPAGKREERFVEIGHADLKEMAAARGDCQLGSLQRVDRPQLLTLLMESL